MSIIRKELENIAIFGIEVISVQDIDTIDSIDEREKLKQLVDKEKENAISEIVKYCEKNKIAFGLMDNNRCNAKVDIGDKSKNFLDNIKDIEDRLLKETHIRCRNLILDSKRMTINKLTDEQADVNGVSYTTLEYLDSLLFKSIEDKLKKEDIKKKIKDNNGINPTLLFRTFYRINEEVFYMEIDSIYFVENGDSEDLENLDINNYIESLKESIEIWDVWSNSQDYDCFGLYARCRKVKNSNNKKLIQMLENNLINANNLVFDFALKD